MRIDVIHCAACGEDHKEMIFAELPETLKVKDDNECTHVAICPNTGEPLFLSQVETTKNV